MLNKNWVINNIELKTEIENCKSDNIEKSSSENKEKISKNRDYEIAPPILYLNDDYVGGEITFPHVGNGITVKPEAGSAIFFPSNFVFTHRISEVSSGTRYALPNWYHNMLNKINTDGSE